MRTFWYYLTIASVIWYSVVTLYVAFKGTLDIREMLENLRNRKH